jgi:hypothetical protein
MYGDAVFGGPAGNHGPQRFRYLLWRCWEPDQEQLTFILCNPSRAGGLADGALPSDPTVDRLIDITLHNAAGGFVLVNLIADVEPKLSGVHDAALEGPDNKSSLEWALGLSNRLVVGWGARPQLKSPRESVIQRIGDRECWCVGINQVSGTPRHPLQRGPKTLGLEPCTTLA